VLRRLFRRSWVRKREKVELWNGNVEAPWREQIRWLFWPALKRVFENRRRLPEKFAEYPHLVVHRFRSDAEVEAFPLQSIQASESMSGSSNGNERQKTPPFAET